MTPRRVVLAAHGTRHAPGRACVERIRDALSVRLGEPVGLGYVDVCAPRLDDVVTDGDLVVPAFLGDGFHVQHDIPHAAAMGEDVALTRHLGSDDAIFDALDARVREAGGPWPTTLLAWAGSRKPASRAQAEAVAATMRERWAVDVHLVTPKTLDDELTSTQRRGSEPGIATWLLAPGRFSEQFAETGLPCSEPLGEHPVVIDALARLVAEARA